MMLQTRLLGAIPLSMIEISDVRALRTRIVEAPHMTAARLGHGNRVASRTRQNPRLEPWWALSQLSPMRPIFGTIPFWNDADGQTVCRVGRSLSQKQPTMGKLKDPPY
jgi:hypothetical protein